MAFGLPARDEPNWDTKLDASINAVKETADAALPASQKNAASGVAPLDADGLLPEANVPTRLTESGLSASYGVVRNVAPGESISDAITASVAGDRVVLRPGAHTATTLTINKRIEFVVEAGATLTQTASTNGHFVSVTAAGAVVCGRGTIDGNKANQSNSNHAIRVAAADVTVRDVTVLNAKYVGVYVNGVSGAKIRNVTVTDSDYIGIFGEPNGATFSDVQVIDCTVDRSNIAAASISEGGIKLRGSDTYALSNCLVRGNTVKMPTSPADGTAIAIEVWFTAGARVAQNRTTGGAMGVSMAACNHAVTTGNTVYSPSTYGIEVAGCKHSTTSGNTVDGNSLTTQGIALTTGGGVQSDYAVITGNTLRGHTSRAISCTVGASGLSITGNTCVGGDGYIINIGGGTGHTITGNVLNGLSTATKAVMLDTTSQVEVVGNVIKDCTQHGVLLYAASAYTITYITVGDNVMVSVGTPLGTQLSGGAAIGARCRAIGNAWNWSGVATLDWLDYQKDLRSMSGTGTPESAVAAGVGSVYLRTDGASGAVLYTKDAGTGNTGWIAAPSVRTGTATLDFPSVAAGGSQELTISVPGAVVGNTVHLGAPTTIEAGLVWNGYVSAADTVKVRVTNVTGAAIDPASASWKATAHR